MGQEDVLFMEEKSRSDHQTALSTKLTNNALDDDFFNMSCARLKPSSHVKVSVDLSDEEELRLLSSKRKKTSSREEPPSEDVYCVDHVGSDKSGLRRKLTDGKLTDKAGRAVFEADTPSLGLGESETSSR
jgi:hypothetical protein